MGTLQTITSMLTIIVTMLVCCGCFITHVNSISCYRCDALEKERSDCPGWHRRAINSVMDLGDRGGLYTHCLDIRLANGTVLHQDVVPAQPACKSSFIQTWKLTLQRTYQQHVSIICCDWSRCNGENANAAPRGSSRAGPDFFRLLMMAVILPWTLMTWNLNPRQHRFKDFHFLT